MQDRIVQSSDIFQAQMCAISIVQPTRHRAHVFQSFRTDRRAKAHKQTVPFAILDQPRPESEPEKVERRVRILFFPSDVLAINNLRFVRMHFQAALCKPGLQRRHDGLRLGFGFAMDQPVICITAPWSVGKRPRHPGIERIMQKKVCQKRTDNTNNNRANFRINWGLRIPRNCMAAGLTAGRDVEITLVIDIATSIDGEPQP